MVTHPWWRPFRADANAERQARRVGRRQTPPGPLQLGYEVWSAQYEDLRRLIETTIPGEVLGLQHVGSTAVPDLIAKPIIDVDVIVPDPCDENAYVPRLEGVGFRLIFRDELGSDPHRQLTYAHPNANLHVWGPDAIEPRRHALFTSWLRRNQEDRERYAQAKLDAAETSGTHYNDRKAAVVYDIYEHAFAADPAHPHDPRPDEFGTATTSVPA